MFHRPLLPDKNISRSIHDSRILVPTLFLLPTGGDERNLARSRIDFDRLENRYNLRFINGSNQPGSFISLSLFKSLGIPISFFSRARGDSRGIDDRWDRQDVEIDRDASKTRAAHLQG